MAVGAGSLASAGFLGDHLGAMDAFLRFTPLRHCSSEKGRGRRAGGLEAPAGAVLVPFRAACRGDGMHDSARIARREED